MKIQKKELEAVFNLVKATDGFLSLQDARVRDTFIKPLADVTQTYFNDREAVYKHFCIKKGDGTPDMAEGNQYQFAPESVESLNKEVKTLGNEEADVDFPEGIKAILEGSAYRAKIGEAEIIDAILAKI